MFRITLKHLRARKLRLVTSGIAVLLGVAFVAGTMVLTATVTRTFGNLFTDVFAGTDAQVRAEEPFDGPEDGPGSTRPRIEASFVDRVAAVDGVEAADGAVFGFAQIVGKDGEPIGEPGMGPPTFGGSWSSNAELNTWDIRDGRPPRAEGEVIIDAHSADEGDLAVGDRTKVLTQAGPVDVTVVGIAGFGSYDSPGGSTFAGFTLEAAQKYLGEPGKYDAVDVVAEEGVSENEVKRRIAHVLPDGIEVITGAELTEENKDDVQGFIDIIGTVMLVFALIALFVGTFIIYNTFSILVAQRTREMALLRAVGASKRQVTAAVMLEALAVGLIASLLGLLAGIGVAAGLKAILVAFGLDLPAEGLAIEGSTIVTSLLLGTLVSVFAAWFPARRGAKVPPIAAMRGAEIEDGGHPRRRIIAGAVLGVLGLLALVNGLFGSGDNALPQVGLGAFLLLLAVTALGPLVARPVSRVLGIPVAEFRGATGYLARENAMRNPRRTSTTASALMIGVALVSFITIFASSMKASFTEIFDEQFTGDFVVDSGSFGFGGLSIDLADRLRELPELEAVSPLRFAQAEVDGNPESFQGLDASELDDIADIGVVEGDFADLDETGLAVLEEEAEEKGWRIGTKVPFRFTDTGVQELTVRVIYDKEELAEEFFVDTSVLDANVRQQFDVLVFATVADGVSVSDARPAIERITDDYANAELRDRQEFIENQAGFIDVLLNLVYVLLALAVLIAVFGIGNTLALSIVERTRELGLLRAVGMTRGQLRSMIRWEAVLIALFGTVGGLGVGAFFGWAMFKALEDEGFRAFDVPVVSLLVITAIAAAFGVLAAVLPSRRAARLDVLAAISHH